MPVEASPTSRAPRRTFPQMGPRGEGWVALQVVLIVAMAAAGLRGRRWPSSTRSLRLLAAGPAALAGAYLLSAGIGGLGRQLTPFPKPVEQASLRRDGAYGLVRHPMYGGVLLLALAWSLVIVARRAGPDGGRRRCSSTPSVASRNPGSARSSPSTRRTGKRSDTVSCPSCGESRTDLGVSSPAGRILKPTGAVIALLEPGGSDEARRERSRAIDAGAPGDARGMPGDGAPPPHGAGADAACRLCDSRSGDHRQQRRSHLDRHDRRSRQHDRRGLRRGARRRRRHLRHRHRSPTTTST